MLYNVPAKDVTVIDGACGNASDSITLQWQKQNNITLNFAKNDTVGRFELTQLHFNINASSVFADAKCKYAICVEWGFKTYRQNNVLKVSL